MDSTQDLMNKTMVVTGATAGIGRAALQALVARGARVIGVGRSAQRCRAVQGAVLEEIRDADLSFVVADLASQRQIRRLASDVEGLVRGGGGDHVDVLVNCAGTVSSWRRVTEDGYELQFAVNHLAPFLLTHALMPMLQAAPSARVVTVSSGSHYNARMHWQDLMYRRHYRCLAAYKQSKLANVLFVAELNRRLAEENAIRAYAADPGLVNTDIGLKNTGGMEKLVWKMRQHQGTSPEKAARTVVHLATEPLDGNEERIYWKHSRPTRPSARALQREEAARLWAISERLCGLDA